MNGDDATYLLFIIWLGSEIILARMKHSRPSDTPHDRLSLRLIWIVIILSITAGVFISFHSFGRIAHASQLFRTTGIVLIICGLIIRWIAILSLKQQFTVDVAITKDHRLITGGIYRYLRHPSYTGSLLSFLGLGIFYSNIASLCVIFLPVCSAFLFRIHVEETILLKTFGEEYRNYCRSTKRLLPGVY